MDFLFINPITFELSPSPQLGQLILHNIVQKEFETSWINFDLLNKEGTFKYSNNIEDNIRRMADYICSYNSKIVGFYTICNSFDITLELSKLIKEKQTNPPVIILGGPHASELPAEILTSFHYIDVICIGEGEKTILPLTASIINKHSTTSLHNIAGIAFRDELGEIIRTPCPSLLSASELGKYTVFDFCGKYNVDPDQSLSIEGGRGCPFRCTFCSTSKFWGAKHRVKPVDVLINEMDLFHKLYGAHIFSIVHDHFTANRNYIIEFCDAINEKPYEWTCSSRADILDEELIYCLRNSGCTRIYLGIESGSQRMQKELNKRLNIPRVKKVLEKLKQVGMHVTVSFIYCFPNETVSDFLDTVDLIRYCISIGIDVLQLHKFCLYAGSIETNKVPRESLYFDEFNMRMTKSEKNAFSPMGRQLTKNYPSLFIHNYTFQTEVSRRFDDFDLLILLITLHNKRYKITVEYLFRRHSLLEIYDRFYSELKVWSINSLKENDRRTIEMFESDESREALRLSANKTMEKICSCDELALLLWKYERICDEFLNDKLNVAVAELPFNIKLAIKEELIALEKTYIKLSRGLADNKLMVAQVTKKEYNLLILLGYNKVS